VADALLAGFTAAVGWLGQPTAATIAGAACMTASEEIMRRLLRRLP
jgi:hypothetical protein